MSRQTKGNAQRQPSIGGTIAKCVFGVLFLGASFGDPGESNPVVFVTTCLALGLGLIAWGLIPWLKIWKENSLRAEQEAKEERKRAEKKAARENAPRVCPNCGATSRGRVCEYCGTKLG